MIALRTRPDVACIRRLVPGLAQASDALGGVMPFKWGGHPTGRRAFDGSRSGSSPTKYRPPAARDGGEAGIPGHQGGELRQDDASGGCTACGAGGHCGMAHHLALALLQSLRWRSGVDLRDALQLAICRVSSLKLDRAFAVECSLSLRKRSAQTPC
jgi:hypothetical protein